MHRQYRLGTLGFDYYLVFTGLFRREHREVRALEGISFAINAGELVGYIGPNGAGKSTTVKVLSGILVPTAGTCLINGRIPWKERIAHVAQIPLFPQWAQTIFNFLPFRGLMDAPFRLYSGHIPPTEAPYVLAPQLLWTLARNNHGRYMLTRGRKRLVVQGG